MTITLEIPDEVGHELIRLAAERGLTLNDFILEILREALDKAPKPPAPSTGMAKFTGRGKTLHDGPRRFPRRN